MSFKALANQFESKGRTTLKGGQCEGKVEVKNDKFPQQVILPERMGSEYAARLRKNAEMEREFAEMHLASKNQGIRRIDVTSGEVNDTEQVDELSTIGTHAPLVDLNKENLTNVYKRYKFDEVEIPDGLDTIHNNKEEILDMIENNPVCIISGPTGCGKSTQIPQFILDSHVAKDKPCNIVVTQPRRIAAIGIAKRVCEERGWGEPGGIVGYQVGLDKQVEQDTRLLYCTTGVLLEKFINTKDMNQYSHVILDEVHEREEDMDLLLLIVKRFLSMNSQNVKVVLMSATMDVEKFAAYFQCKIGTKFYPAPNFTIEMERKYEISVFYLDSLLDQRSAINAMNQDEPNISEEAYNLVPQMILHFNTIDKEDFNIRVTDERIGAVLIFLPGLQQIETLYEILSKECEKKETEDLFKLWLCPLHSSITKDEQQKVVSRAPKGKRKVILSTNIAESSVTIPDVKYVIDFCLTKHLYADPKTGFTSLRMAWASHVNCTQREGRVGRVQIGRVYRMVTKSFYQFQLPKTSPPEMCRCPLDIVILKCKRLMENECPLRIVSEAMDPPELENYDKTVDKLKEIGALLRTTNGEEIRQDGDLTFMGLVMGSLPLDIRITKLILLGHLFDVLEDAIIMGCAMSVRNIFSEPFKQRLEAYTSKLLWADQSESDSIAYLTAYQVWRHLTGIGKFQRSKGSETSYGKTYMLQIKHLKEVSVLEQEVKDRLKRFKIQTAPINHKPLWDKNQKPTILKLALAGAFYPNYYSCSSQNPNAESEAVQMVGGQNPYQCVYLQQMAQPAIIYFDQIRRIFQENNVSEYMEFHADTSQKLVVEFHGSSTGTHEIGDKRLIGDIPGNIEMPVYRAIKLRQLSSPNSGLTIRTYTKDIAAAKLQEYPIKSLMFSETQSSEYKPAIPLDEVWVEIAVSEVVDAGTFYGHVQPSTIEKLAVVYNQLNDHRVLFELSGEVEHNAIYAAPYKDYGDEQVFYYRAKVIRKQWMKTHYYVDVFFIDYGNTVQNMDACHLREIIGEEAQRVLVETIPPLALKCVLAEVAPTSVNNNCWSEKANDFVKKILKPPHMNTPPWTMEVYSLVNGVASVNLFLEDEGKNGRNPLTLNQLLVEKNFAVPKEESFQSKKNHEIREQKRKGVQPYTVTSDLKTVLPNLENVIFSAAKSNHPLKGPFSPLEMKLYGKTKSSTQKEIRVDGSSVNSVLLDSEPNEPFEKLLVAGHVTLQADRTRLNLNHTTVLPNIYGLAALTCLIFAPSVELRSDIFRSRYIGALCGLGGRIFPENDMEIKFDVEIDDEDLLLINKIRFLMNRRFANEKEDMAEYQIVKTQERIQILLIKLLSKRRQAIKVEHNEHPYLWNVVDEDDLISPYAGEAEQISLNGVYHLIHAINLDSKRDFEYIQDLVNKVNHLTSCIKRDSQPKDLKCDLCDYDFKYWKQLREHWENSYHLKLTDWLRARASFHGLEIH